MSATVPPIICVMYGCSAAIYSCLKPVLPQCRQAYTRARTLSIYKYILRHCDRHNFMLLTSLNYKYFQVWKIVSTFALSNLS